jgi:hypothetical protein
MKGFGWRKRSGLAMGQTSLQLFRVGLSLSYQAIL